MNILHLKYAVEVASTRSISKAAENLFMGQPNLSRAIKELEDSLGITIFRRTSKGISITAEGEEFLQYARKIISQINEVEELYMGGKKEKQTFSVCVPRSSYISYAMAEFAKSISTDVPAEVIYKETNSMRAINNVINEDYDIGIIRYQSSFGKYFRTLFTEKKLASETVTEFSYVLLYSKDSRLAKEEVLTPHSLSSYIEIVHGDPYVPSLPTIDVKKAELSEYVDKRICVFERASQFDLLSRVPDTFMWVSPIPEELCERYGLVQRKCDFNSKIYRDVLIYRKGYTLTELDRRFITAVCDAKRKYIDNEYSETVSD